MARSDDGEDDRGSDAESVSSVVSSSTASSSSDAAAARGRKKAPAAPSQPQKPASDGPIVIRVHNLTKNVRVAHVREIFGKFGTIKELESYEKDPICDFPQGRCTIEYSQNEEAIEAFANMKGAQIDGEEITISLIKISRKVIPVARPRERSRSPVPPPSKRPATMKSKETVSKTAGTKPKSRTT